MNTDWTTGWEPLPDLTPDEVAAGRAYPQRVERRIAETGSALRQTAAEVLARYDLTDLADEAWRAEASPIVREGLMGAQDDMRAYLFNVGLEDVQMPDVDMDTPTISHAISKGRWYASEGMSGGVLVDQIGSTVSGWYAGDHQSAMRSVTSASDAIAGYRKVAGGTACNWCVETSQRMYYRGVPYHRDDKCGVVPVMRRNMSATEAARSDSATLFGRTTFGHSRAASYRDGQRVSPVYERTSAEWIAEYSRRRQQITLMRDQWEMRRLALMTQARAATR